MRPRVRLGRHHECGRSVVERGRIARGHREVAGLHVLGCVGRERGLELGQTLGRCIPTRTFIGGDHRGSLASRYFDRHDLAREFAGVHRGHRFAMRLQREFVLRDTRDLGLPRGVLRVPAHVHVTHPTPQPIANHAVDQRLVAELVAIARPVQIERCVGHRFLPARQQELGVAGANRLGREHHRFQSRAAHLVDGDRGHGGRHPALERGLPRRGLPDTALDDIAHDDFLQRGGVDPGALDRGPDRHRAEIRGGERGQATQEPADWRARRRHDDGGALQRKCIRHEDELLEASAVASRNGM